MARITLPVNDVTRAIVALPSLITATGAEGLVFNNPGGNVFLEVISSTTGQQFTVLTGLILESQWAVADTLATITGANTTYYIGSFPPNIYNQDTVNNQIYVDHAVNAVLQFRAWRLT